MNKCKQTFILVNVFLFYIALIDAAVFVLGNAAIIKLFYLIIYQYFS